MERIITRNGKTVSLNLHIAKEINRETKRKIKEYFVWRYIQSAEDLRKYLQKQYKLDVSIKPREDVNKLDIIIKKENY